MGLVHWDEVLCWYEISCARRVESLKALMPFLVRRVDCTVEMSRDWLTLRYLGSKNMSPRFD